MKVRLNYELFDRKDPNAPRIAAIMPLKKVAGECQPVDKIGDELDSYIDETFGSMDLERMRPWEKDLFATATLEAFFSKHGYEFCDRIPVDDEAGTSIINRIQSKLQIISRLIRPGALFTALSGGTFLHPLLFLYFYEEEELSKYDGLLGTIFHNGKYYVLMADISKYHGDKLDKKSILEVVLAWWAKKPLEITACSKKGDYRMMTNVLIHGSKYLPVQFLNVFPFSDDERIDKK